MSGGYICYYFGGSDSPCLTEFERLFSPVGLYLANPATGQIFALSATGEQIVATREEIESQIAARNDVNLQWWVNDSEDMYCGFHTDTMNGRWRLTLRLDGMDPGEVAAVIERLLLYFRDHCERGDSALVVDRTGALEDVNWDAVVTGGQPMLQMPDILVLPRAVIAPSLDVRHDEFTGCPLHIVLRADLQQMRDGVK